MKAIIFCLFLISCNVYKPGTKTETWNYKHLKKVYAKQGGMWAGKKYITFNKK